MNRFIHTQAFRLIRKLYGKNAKFREGQYEAVEAVLTYRRTLVVQKTGWGKSLIYFICTRILRDRNRGVTIVVSPLLVLMKNQQSAAEKFGLHCVSMNSSTKNERSYQIAQMKANRLDIVFITPETLFSNEVQAALPSVQIGLFVVDEAHCISDWGHDFRLEYSRLNQVIQNMPQQAFVLGTTATANNRVINDLQQQFGEDVYISRGQLMRRSLSIQILHLATPTLRYAWILQNVPKISGSGIIYCLTQRDCDYLADFLKKNGVKAQAYHSGMELQETIQSEQKLYDNQLKVLVATIKLGMGYDKDDIAFVIHYQQPSNIVAYYQQIGRAGRNIDRAYTFLMCGEEDKNIQNYFIETAFPTQNEAKTVYDVIFKYSKMGVTKKQIEENVNIRKSRIEKTLMFLQNEKFVVKDKTKYYPTLHKFNYNQEHYDEIKAIRHREQEQMHELIHTKQCLSRFIVNCLDDSTKENCGICQNCLGFNEYPEKPDIDFIQKAQEYLEKLVMPIKPRKQFPSNDFTGHSKISIPNHEGLCLSKYGDPGYGELVRRGKYENTQRFCEELVTKSANVLRPVIKEHKITAITCIPSLRSTIVADFTKRLAKKLGFQFVQLLQKNGRIQQKEMENSYFQCRNAWKSFKLHPNISKVPSRIILVDDIVDSKWTITVCGYLLTQAGCELVFPFALADSSEN